MWTRAHFHKTQSATLVGPDEKDDFGTRMLALAKDATSLVDLYREKCAALKKLQDDYQTLTRVAAGHMAESVRMQGVADRLTRERDQSNLMADGYAARAARAQLRIDELELLLNGPAAGLPRRKFNLGGSA